MAQLLDFLKKQDDRHQQEALLHQQETDSLNQTMQAILAHLSSTSALSVQPPPIPVSSSTPVSSFPTSGIITQPTPSSVISTISAPISATSSIFSTPPIIPSISPSIPAPIPGIFQSLPQGLNAKIPGIPLPTPLSADSTLRVYEEWKASWEDYVIMAGLNSHPQRLQLAYLRRCLDSEMKEILTHSIGVPVNSSMPVSDIIDLIDTHMRRQRNQTLRRQQFTQCRQSLGQSFDAFYVRLKQAASDAELCRHCIDDRLLDGIIAGICDRDLSERIQALATPPSLTQVVNMCRSHEAAHKSNAELPSQAKVNKLTKYAKGKRSRSQPPENKDNSKTGQSTQSKPSCFGCGNKANHSDGTCPAKGVECKKCHKFGHFSNVCQGGKMIYKKNKSKFSFNSNSKTANANCVTVSGFSNSDYPSSPTIQLQVDFGKKRSKLVITPDTGAEMTSIGLQHFQDLGGNLSSLEPCPDISVYAANGSSISSIGKFLATVTYFDITLDIWIHVFRDFPMALLSWYHAQALGIIPKDYPRPCLQRPFISQIVNSPCQTNIHDDRAKILQEFSDVFSSSTDTHDLRKLRKMNGSPMKIHLKPDAQPFAIYTPRVIPLAWRDAVKKELDSMTSQDIIEPVGDEACEWCHPLVVVPKPKGGVRLTVDLSRLNKQVLRTAHPSPTPNDAVRQVTSGACFFTILDATMGYWQIPLSEDVQHLTTFITPWGRYRFKRSPMGFISSGDEFCRRGDIALSGTSNCVKVIDDILAWDSDYDSHLQRVREILTRCRQHGITINADKFVFASSQVQYCGYSLSQHGITADANKVKAISEFPTPSNLTDLRSFMGLANQLGNFTPALSTSANILRPLLSTKNQFIWTSAHQESFEQVKKALTSTPTLAIFDPSLPTALHTDASRLYGIGFALLQKHGEKWRLIQCGSRFLTDAETRYATIELELVAAVWGMQKCRLYLLGLQSFDLVLDHKPLLPILNAYTLDAVQNPRLQRLKEKISGYSFKAVWKKGKEHAIPDALSRSPVDKPDKYDLDFNKESSLIIGSLIMATTSEISQFGDPILNDLQAAASTDDLYNQLLNCVKNGFPISKSGLPNDLLPFWKIRHDLTHDNGIVLYGQRIIVPTLLRRNILDRLHDSHRGTEATKLRARQSVWWPGINNDIITTVESCISCQILKPSQQKEPLRSTSLPSRPFEAVSADLFSHAGKSYLVYADRYTGWTEVHPYSKDTTSKATLRAFRKFFGQLGVPTHLRTDGGPQFSSSTFRAFMKKWGVNHEMSSPHYPQSNGHAEVNVKQIKHLIIKTSPKGDIFDNDSFSQGLLELRNTPRKDGLSPAVILLGRPLRSLVPTHRTVFAQKWLDAAEDWDQKRSDLHDTMVKKYNSRAKPLPSLKSGTEVRVQHHDTKRWDIIGTIVHQGHNRDYQIRTPSGKILWRNRRFIRPVPQPCSEGKHVHFSDNV